MSDSNLKRLTIMEDAKALCILDRVISHGNRVESRILRREIVEELDAMSRSTFWEKLNLIEREGLLRREAMMEGNKAVTYIVIAEPFLGIVRQWSSDPLFRLLGKATERLRAPGVLAEEKEKILAGLLKGYLRGAVGLFLKAVRNCIQSEDQDEAARALSLSAHYLFGLRLTEIGLLYQTFREYGAGALLSVEEFFRNFREKELKGEEER